VPRLRPLSSTRDPAVAGDDVPMTLRCRRPVLRLLLLLGLLLAAAPAGAHEADPRIVTSLVQVSPALPEPVVVQVQAGIATQLVASNPTPTVLEVVGTSGRAFLRLSSGGVLADVGAAEFFTTSNPTGAAPAARRRDGPVRWQRISAGSSWGWYDHRLHPAELRAPTDQQREVRLAEFEVPLRYGATEVVATGRVDFRPLRGSFLVSADPAPAGLSVQALPGRLPGVFLSAPAGTEVAVQGRDGEPFLRITDAGVEVNERSRTHVEDRQARGQVVGPPSTTPAFRLVAPGTRSYTWLDARLRYRSDLPPSDALAADGPTRLEQWRVPVQVDGRSMALTGAISWVPEAVAAERVSGRAAPEEGSGLLLPLLVGTAVLVLLGAVVAVRNRKGAQAGQ
jgi:hypothetical protein